MRSNKLDLSRYETLQALENKNDFSNVVLLDMSKARICKGLLDFCQLQLSSAAGALMREFCRIIPDNDFALGGQPVCWESNKNLMSNTDLSQSALYRGLEDLEQAGLIVHTHSRGQKRFKDHKTGQKYGINLAAGVNQVPELIEHVEEHRHREQVNTKLRGAIKSKKQVIARHIPRAIEHASKSGQTATQARLAELMEQTRDINKYEHVSLETRLESLAMIHYELMEIQRDLKAETVSQNNAVPSKVGRSLLQCTKDSKITYKGQFELCEPSYQTEPETLSVLPEVGGCAPKSGSINKNQIESNNLTICERTAESEYSDFRAFDETKANTQKALEETKAAAAHKTGAKDMEWRKQAFDPSKLVSKSKAFLNRQGHIPSSSPGQITMELVRCALPASCSELNMELSSWADLAGRLDELKFYVGLSDAGLKYALERWPPHYVALCLAIVVEKGERGHQFRSPGGYAMKLLRLEGTMDENLLGTLQTLAKFAWQSGFSEDYNFLN